MPKPNWGGAASGTASGAISGAAVGSAIPVIGTAIGAVGGGVLGFFNGLFGGGKKKKKKKLSTLDPQTQALYDDYVASLRGEGTMNDLFNYNAEEANKNFDLNVSRPAYRNFNENVIPGITGQYRQNNLMNSSYSGEALGRAGRNVQENLDALRSNTHLQGQNQANQNKINGLNTAFGTQTFAYEQPGAQTPNPIDQILNSLGPASGEWFADYLKKSNSPAPVAAAA